MTKIEHRQTASGWRRWRGVLQLTGIGLLVWVFSRLDMALILSALLEMQPGYLAMYVLLFMAAMVLRAGRLRWLLMRQGHHAGLWRSYVLTVEASLWGSLTPARAGEVSKVFGMRDVGVPVRRGLFVVLMERMFDLLVFGLLVMGGVLYFAEYFFSGGAASAGIVIVMGLFALLVLYVRRAWLLSKMEKMLARLTEKWSAGSQIFRKSDMEKGARLLADTWVAMLLFSALLGAIGAIEVYLLAKALNMNIGLAHVVFSYSAASIVALAPISFNGLGTREATYIYLLSLSGVAAEPATLLSLLDGVALPLLMTVAMAFPIWRAGSRKIPAKKE